MITLIEALSFRCLRYIKQPLGPFHVLVGPNASGKTTFLDVVAFLGRLVSDDLEAAIDERTRTFDDLVWGRTGKGFELAVEAKIPEDRREKLANKQFEIIRYEVSIGLNPDTSEVSILGEKAFLKKFHPASEIPIQREFFPHMCRLLSYGPALLMPVVSLHPSGESSINVISLFH